ncbi:type II toxin-antitoxin system VapC family toxin [Rhizobium laguerreae]|uniref:type II toxin-antitoxin system VapC family toxin n=1 Tax=Rhizobium laguerreae TaxID=1076926 RepID=UPI001C90A5C2|nr:PIN domain-containing protein [Rhizobium laguerreae]MBY3378954.1 type II toxin-antitoxin system VapC family toxin [Rhizobium laguerreae]
MSQIILDTNIISVAQLPQKPQWILDWLDSLPLGSVAIPWVLIYEVEYGIQQARRTNLAKALFVTQWFEEFLQQSLIILDMNVEAARTLGRMAACPPLRQFFETLPRTDRKGKMHKNDRINLGCDAILAALSIAHGLPIATCNDKDFLRIHAHFPMPGVYNPQSDDWVVPPPVGWGMMDHANDDEPDRDVGEPFQLR